MTSVAQREGGGGESPPWGKKRQTYIIPLSIFGKSDKIIESQKCCRNALKLILKALFSKNFAAARRLELNSTKQQYYMFIVHSNFCIVQYSTCYMYLSTCTYKRLMSFTLFAFRVFLKHFISHSYCLKIGFTIMMMMMISFT